MDNLSDKEPNTYNFINKAFEYYKEASSKYEGLLEKIVELTTLLRKIEDLPDNNEFKRELNSLQKDVESKINELNRDILSKISMSDNEMEKKWSMTEDILTEKFNQHKDIIDKALSTHKKEITTKYDTNDDRVVASISELRKTISLRDDKIEGTLKTLNDILSKLTDKLYLTIGLLALVSVVGSGAMIYIKYATESINKVKHEQQVEDNKQFYIIDEHGNKLPVLTK